MADTDKPERLCSEIQLFDLCDLDTCAYKNGRYCTKRELLARFEAIEDREEEQYPDQYVEDGEDLESDDDGFDYDETEDEEDVCCEDDYGDDH